jgi:CBS domain-containing protein
MSKKQFSIQKATVADLIASIGQRQLPQVSPGAKEAEIVAAFGRAEHARLVYVVDGQQQLVGVISLGNLTRHLLFHLSGAEMDNLHLLNMALAETAEDYIDRQLITANLSESIELVLKRMLKAAVKEVPVLDGQGRLVADLTLVDILNGCSEDLLKNREFL